MFKLLALRVLDGCDEHIRKCLKSNVYYYFCTDFRFEVQGKVYRKNKYAESLPEDFFALPDSDSDIPVDNTSPTIHLNAIVGKNGDGKSTLVELMIRMINDYVATKQKEKSGFKKGNKLQLIKDIEAELYFQEDATIYKLHVTDDIHDVKKITEITDAPYFDIIEEDAPSDVFASIYTLVSNYSHYAYNIFDFEREWNKSRKELSTEIDKNNACWLFHIFHKNDGYSTPISLHPYRESGIININKEARLSKQRLLYLFIKSRDANNAFRNILEGMTAEGLRLIPRTDSKLHDRSILDHFIRHEKEDTSLDWAIPHLEELAQDLVSAPNRQEYEFKNLKKTYFSKIMKALRYIIDGSGCTETYAGQYQEFLTSALEWLDSNFLSNPGYLRDSAVHSNLASYINAVREIRRLAICENIEAYLPIEADLKRYEAFRRYNIKQLARLRTIYDIAQLHKYDTRICFPQTGQIDNNPASQCRCYMIYKAISIFETYPDYIEIHKKYKKVSNATPCIEYAQNELKDLWSALQKDASHVTRKYRQAKNYIKAYIHNNHKDFYRPLATPQTQELKAHIDIKLNKLQSYYNKTGISLEQLPPPIYDTEILFSAKDSDNIKMSELSSGEKQILGSIGAIIYHLVNIDSAKTTPKYKSINLILEEIELYFHPDYQRKYACLLIGQIRGAQLQFIQNISITFVTHSPFVLSDIPKCNVLFLKDGKPDYQMQENTFGANIHSLLKNGFFLPNLPMGEFAYQKINDLFRKFNENEFDKDEENIARLREEISIVGEPYLREQLYKSLKSQLP